MFRFLVLVKISKIQHLNFKILYVFRFLVLVKIPTIQHLNCKTFCHCTSHSDIAQCSWTLRNTPRHCAMLKKLVTSSSVIIIYSVLNGSLSPKEGPPTFACKSKNADRQDWYIFIYNCPFPLYACFNFFSMKIDLPSKHLSILCCTWCSLSLSFHFMTRYWHQTTVLQMVYYRLL